MALEQYLQGEVAEEFAEGLLTRRDALRRLVGLGLTMSSAGALLAACGRDGAENPSPAGATSTTPPSTTSPSGLSAEAIRFPGPAGELRGAWAAAATPIGGLLLIHENRGLTPHFFDLAARMAREQFSTLAVDLLSTDGGTEAVGDPASALAAATSERLVGEMRAAIDELARRVPGRKIGAMGFCFGGGMTWQLVQSGDARLAAAIPFYGPAPDPSDFSKSDAAVLGIYAELDSRVNASRDRASAALREAGLAHEIRTVPGADHAFFNDTGPRYNKQAAEEANEAVLVWLRKYLA